MATAVVLFLSDEGQMMIGEVDAETIALDDFQEVDTFEDGVQAAEVLLLGEAAPPEIEEEAFNQSVNAPAKSPMEMED